MPCNLNVIRILSEGRVNTKLGLVEHCLRVYSENQQPYKFCMFKGLSYNVLEKEGQSPHS